MEELVLTDPVVVPEKVTNKYRLVSLSLNLDFGGQVMIVLRDNHDAFFQHTYTGDTAIDYIKFINTANFTTKSLHKRILEKLAAEGVLPGTVTGAPDPPATSD